MKHAFSLTLLVSSAALLCAPIVGRAAESAAKSGSSHAVTLSQPRWSAHDVVSRKLDGNRITVIYGRPTTADPKNGEQRKVWGELVPFGKIWRLGADEATTLITQKPIMLGDLDVPAGAYTLFMQPEADGSAKLLVNKEIGQWGIDPYHAESELGRVDMKAEPLAAPVHLLTIAIDARKPSGGALRIEWEDEQFVVPIAPGK